VDNPESCMSDEGHLKCQLSARNTGKVENNLCPF